MSPGRRRAVRALCAVIALPGVAALIFALYAWRVSASPFIADLERQSAAYHCIGDRLFPSRPREQPAVHVARLYLLERREWRGPSLSWHFELAATSLALEAAFRPQERNRMYAALRFREYRGFDGVALALAGRPFCSLDERQKDAVREFGRSGRREKLRALAGASGAA